MRVGGVKAGTDQGNPGTSNGGGTAATEDNEPADPEVHILAVLAR